MNLDVFKKRLQNQYLTEALENPSAYSEKFFSAKSSDIASRLATTPENRPYLVGELLPQGVAGLLTGPGAVGKTTLAMQLAAAIATGTEFLGKPCKQGSVLMYLSEDDNCELTQRLHRINESLGEEYSPDLCRNLKVFPSPMIHLPMFDRAPSGGDPTATEHFCNLWAAAQQIDDLRLIVIDSYTRINNLDEINHSHASYVAQSLEMLARDTGSTVLMIHHPPKQGGNEPRGSGALLNALRWTATLGYSKTSTSHRGRLALTVAKYNYGPTVTYRLQRQENGLLSTTVPEPVESEQDRNARVIDDVCNFIATKADKGKGFSYSNLRGYAGLKNQFQIAQDRLKPLLDEACKQGRLILEDKQYKLPEKSGRCTPRSKSISQDYETI
ncbi:AAA family ATPase [Methylophaga sp.]|uniref:AAA family ATPase n=1 Tax=Methylophaga sp. TaxID=2024840 RepID=UPI003A920457